MYGLGSADILCAIAGALLISGTVAALTAVLGAWHEAKGPDVPAEAMPLDWAEGD